MFFHLVVNKSKSQLCSIDWHFDLLQEKWHSSNMIFMSVCQNECFDFILVVQKICHVRNNNINSWQIVSWKRESSINNDNFIVILKGGHIFSDFTHTAQEGDFEFIVHLISFYSNKNHNTSCCKSQK